MNRKHIIITTVTCLLLLLTFNTKIYASVPYDTKTIGPDKDLVWTQTAYIPIGIFNKDITFNNPSDIYMRNGRFYIADSNNKRIVVLDFQGNLIKTIGEGVLKNPTGVFVTEEDEVYIADKDNKVAYKFSYDNELLFTYNRPTEPLFGKTSEFMPTKLIVDRRKNVYIISDFTREGVIQLNYTGNFLGYFGVNATTMSLRDRFARWVAGKEELSNKLPPSTANIDVDSKGLIYTATHRVPNSIKKLNIQGLDILNPDIYYPEGNIQDIHISNNNDIFVVTDEAIIYEYDNVGNLLFSFGGRANVDQRLGLLNSPSGIVTDESGNLYILDRALNNIQVFQKTEFVDIVHQGINLYREGRYQESTNIWLKVLQMNSSFALAHSNLGKSYFKLQEYDLALQSFRIANDRTGYSDAFWQIRFNWLQNYLGLTLLSLVGIYAIIKIIRYIDKKNQFLEPSRNVRNTIISKKFISEVLLLFRMFKHPLDTFYEIKHRKRASYQSATFWLIILFIEYLIFVYFRAFIFNYTNIETVNIFFEIAKVIGVFLLWTFANYLVSTLTDGEGWFRDVYIGTVYSLAPLILGLLPITIISNYFTFNEQFVYQFSIQVLILWSLILLLFMIKDIHNFTVKETIINILVTLFGVIIIALIIFIVYLLINQLYDFILALIREVIARARYT